MQTIPLSTRPTLCVLLLIGALLPADARAQGMQHHGMASVNHAPPAPLFEGLGPYHRAISTRSDIAQRYFDQGMSFMWGFNLHEAQRSFEACAKADPECAMCRWGEAFSLGPHINVPGLPDRTRAANAANQQARALEGQASPGEKALIEAMSKRYSDPPPANPDEQKKLDTAYADAMREVRKQFPDDLDIAALGVEAMMDLRPWDLWLADGTPQPGTEEIVSTLEWILANDPGHVGANHYYIHAVEASQHPERAVKSAEQLGKLNSAAGHLTHMPAHVYERLGRWDDAFEANRRALEMDAKYEAKANPIQPESFYPMYTAHNAQFLSVTAMMQGRRADAIRYARLAVGKIPLEMISMMPGFDFFLMTPVFVHARFGEWDEMLKEAAPPKGFPYCQATWHYGRGLAFTGKGKLDAAGAELDSVRTIAKTIPADALEGFNSAQALLGIASDVLAASMAAKRGKNGEAIRLLTKAVAAEDQTRYDEPPDWMWPVRHTLGAALLQAGRAAEAEAVYREDLKRNPENGWALYGLAESLRRQKKVDEARAVSGRFEKAWQHADTRLTASNF